MEVFLSYARQDRRWKDKLVEHLSLLKQQGYITVWYDQDISAGMEWQQRELFTYGNDFYALQEISEKMQK